MAYYFVTESQWNITNSILIIIIIIIINKAMYAVSQYFQKGSAFHNTLISAIIVTPYGFSPGGTMV